MLEKGSRRVLLALFVLLASGAHVKGEGVRYSQETKVDAQGPKQKKTVDTSSSSSSSWSPVWL